MPGKILGIDIKSDSVTGVLVQSRFKGYHITRFSTAPIQEPGGLAQALEDLGREGLLQADTCVCSVPGEKISYRNIRLPFRDIKKIRQVISFELDNMLPFSVDDVAIDFNITGEFEQTGILALSIKKEYISWYLETLQRHGLEPEILDVEGVALVSCLLSRDDITETGLFLDIGPRKCTLIAFRERRISLVRSLPIYEEKAGNSGYPFQKLCREILNTIRAFKYLEKNTLSPEKVFITGSGSLHPDADVLLKRFFGLPVERIDLAGQRGVCMGEDLARSWSPETMDKALALALRETKQGRSFNFRKGEFEIKRKYQRIQRELRKAAVLLAIIISLLTFYAGMDYFFLKGRYKTLDKRITHIFSRTLPGVKRIEAPVQQLAIKIEEMKKSSVSLPGMGKNIKVLDLLRDISIRVPRSIDAAVDRMIFEPGGVQIKGETDTFNTVDNLKKALEKSAYFEEAIINSANLDRTGKHVLFEIKLQIAGT